MVLDRELGLGRVVSWGGGPVRPKKESLQAKQAERLGFFTIEQDCSLWARRPKRELLRRWLGGQGTL